METLEAMEVYTGHKLHFTACASNIREFAGKLTSVRLTELHITILELGKYTRCITSEVIKWLFIA